MKITQWSKLPVCSTCLLLLAVGLFLFVWVPTGVLGAPGAPPDPTPEANPGEAESGLKPPEEKIIGPAEFAPPAGPDAANANDTYGYNWNDGLGLSWVDASGGTQVFPIEGHTKDDDETAGPFDLPWSFPFYENSYSQIYISTNGLIGFDNSIAGRNDSLENLTIPFDYEFPNDFIAPFWDDLLIGGGVLNDGKVYYDNGTDGYGNYFVVEWHQVTRNGAGEAGKLLTFEVLLYQNGDIRFQYFAMDPAATLDSSTVGIEDGDGYDGLQYQFNTAAVGSGDAILFDRPNPAHRVKLFPRQRSGFALGGEASFSLQVRNTGNISADSYNLAAVPGQPGWQTAFYDEASQAPLVNSGPLAIGETINIIVKVSAPPGAVVGDGSDITVTATSTNDGAKTAQATLSTAVPAPFIATYREGADIIAEAFWQERSYPVVEHESYTGSSFALEQAAYPNYFAVWEKNRAGLYTDLVYNFVNSTGQVLYPDRFINNLVLIVSYRDIKPMVAVAPNGNIGVTWVRTETRFGTQIETRNNIYFTLLDPQGNYLFPVTSPTEDHILKVTDADWYTGTEPNVEQHDAPNIAAVGNRFHLAWVERHILSTATTTDLNRAVFAADGYGIIKAPTSTHDPENADDDIDYGSPGLAAYKNPSDQNLVMLAYYKNDNSGGTPANNLLYTLLTPDGAMSAPEQPATDINNANCTGLDIVQLNNDKVALAWTDLDVNKVTYVILNHDLTGPPTPTALDNPDNRLGGRVSVTYDDQGRAVLTWMDAKWFGRLYYALVDQISQITMPMIYKYPRQASASALETRSVQGNAPYTPWYRMDLPLMMR